MKARRVKGVRCEAPLADGAERIVAVRLDELCSFVPKALDPAEVERLHDMRIAAKRLRYVLEVTGPAFGPYAATAIKRTKDLQDLLGEIHDCDVTVPQVLALIDELRATAVSAVLAHAPAPDLPAPGLAATVADGEAWRGLEAYVVHLRARRERLFAQFRARWTELEREGFRARLEYAIAERPGEPVGELV